MRDAALRDVNTKQRTLFELFASSRQEHTGGLNSAP